MLKHAFVAFLAHFQVFSGAYTPFSGVHENLAGFFRCLNTPILPVLMQGGGAGKKLIIIPLSINQLIKIPVECPQKIFLGLARLIFTSACLQNPGLFVSDLVLVFKILN